MLYPKKNKENILIGFYSGLGDLVCCLDSLENDSSKFNIFLAVEYSLKDFINELYKGKFKIIFFEKSFSGLISLFISILKYKISSVYFSPHAQEKKSSFKLPLFFSFLRLLSIRLIGAKNQKLSFIFNKSLEINMKSSISQRERVFFNENNIIQERLIKRHNSKNIKEFNQNKKNINNSIFFHVGAGKKNRRFSDDYLITLIDKLLYEDHYNLTVCGHSNEIQILKNHFINNINIHFIHSSLNEACKAMLSSSVAITMDSGFAHLCAYYKHKHICIVGPAEPDLVRPYSKNTNVLFNRTELCQPCNSDLCIHEVNKCLSNIPFNLIRKSIKEIIE